METLKQEAIRAISKLPESANIDDIMYELYVIDKMPIPLIPATDSEGSRPAIPIESGHLFRSKAATLFQCNSATLSERSDAGT